MNNFENNCIYSGSEESSTPMRTDASELKGFTDTWNNGTKSAVCEQDKLPKN